MKELKETLDAKERSAEVKAQARKIIRERILLEIKKQAVDDGEKNCSKFRSKRKTVLNRIEKLFNSNKTKQEIQSEIKVFKKTAKDNLEKMFIGTNNLLEILMGKAKLPYANIYWEERLGLNDKNLKMIEDMTKD